MIIRNSFRIPAPPAAAWVVLNDIPRVARCAPGAELLEEREDGSYVGTVAVRLGPVSLSFKGVFAYKEKDEANYRVVADASGNEAKARGTARAVVTFTLAPDGTGTRVDVESDVQLAGSIAQYGRGAALIQSTAQVIIDQFATNLAKEFNADQPPVAAPTAAAPVAAPVESAAGDGAPAPAAQPEPLVAPPRPLPPSAKPISLTSVLWLGFLNWLRGLFGKRA
jgi:carbon monoxide dehydrogenase subunit G